MNNHINAINHMRAVTISYQYGTGGSEIASCLAQHLGWKLMDHEIVECVASELGTSVQEAEVYDEYAAGIFERMVNNLQYIDPLLMAAAQPFAFYANETTYRETTNEVVRSAAARGHAVIVGRASQVLLAERQDILHVRIISSLEQRVAYVMQHEGLNQTSAQACIRREDRKQTRYLKTVHSPTSRDAHLYDVILNMSHLHLQSAVEFICLALQRKSKQRHPLCVKTMYG